MSTCPLEAQADRWHDGELDPPQRQAFAEHLPHCPLCQGRIEQLQAVSRHFQEHPWPTLAPIGRQRLNAALEQAAIAQARSQARLRLTARSLLATAAAILLASLLGIWSSQQALPQRGGGASPLAVGSAAANTSWELLAVGGEASERVSHDALAPEMQLARWMAQDLGRPQDD